MKLLIIYLFLFSFFISFSQNEQQIDTIGKDVFEALYTLKNNILFKTLNDKTVSYQNLALGDIATVDIINSQEIVIFYLDYNSVVILDNQLNQIVQIQFAETILFVRKGIVNHLWRFNDSNHTLELYDYKSKTVSRTSQIILDFVPSKMESNFNSVKLIGANKTLLFNQYLYLTDTVIH